MIEVVLNQLSADGMKMIRVISDRRVTEAWLWSLVPGASREFATVKPWETAALNVFYGEVTFPVRGVVRFQVPGVTNRWRSFAAWRLMDGEGYRVSEIIEFLSEWYFAQTKRKPGYAFMRKLPAGVVSGFMCQVSGWDEGVELQQAEWCLEKCVLVGG
jgi:hypothetical protein